MVEFIVNIVMIIVLIGFIASVSAMAYVLYTKFFLRGRLERNGVRVTARIEKILNSGDENILKKFAAAKIDNEKIDALKFCKTAMYYNDSQYGAYYAKIVCEYNGTVFNGMNSGTIDCEAVARILENGIDTISVCYNPKHPKQYILEIDSERLPLEGAG